MFIIIKLRISILIILVSLIFQISDSSMKAQIINSYDDLDSLSSDYDFLRTNTGNFLIGELKYASKGKLSFDIEDVEQDDINLEDVSAIIAKSLDFQIDIEGKGRVVGKIDKGDVPGYFKVYSSTDTAMYLIEDIVLLKQIKTLFWDRVDGSISIGYSYNNSSDVGRLNLSDEFSYKTVNLEIFQPSSISLTFAEGTKSVDLIDIGLGGYYDFYAKWLALQYFEYQKINSFGLSDRGVTITSAGRRIVHNTFLDLNILTGITFQKEIAANGVVGGLQAEIPLVVDFNLGIISPELNLKGLTFFFASLAVKDRYRIDSKINFYYDTDIDITIGLQLTYQYDSKPLDPTQRNSNVDISTTLSFDL